MSDDTDKRQPGAWGWIGAWVAEEKFWRDIGTRVLAGVITAAIIYAGALLLGYLHTPEIGAGLLLALGIIACVILLSGVVAIGKTIRARARAGSPIAARVVTAIILLVCVAAIAIGVVGDVVLS